MAEDKKVLKDEEMGDVAGGHLGRVSNEADPAGRFVSPADEAPESPVMAEGQDNLKWMA